MRCLFALVYAYSFGDHLLSKVHKRVNLVWANTFINHVLMKLQYKLYPEVQVNTANKTDRKLQIQCEMYAFLRAPLVAVPNATRGAVHVPIYCDSHLQATTADGALQFQVYFNY